VQVRPDKAAPESWVCSIDIERGLAFIGLGTKSQNVNAIIAAKGRIRRLIPLLVAVMLAGCVTSKIDWAGRVGNYTYDQAVMEMGPPDKQAKLGDGTVVAEWLTWRGQRYVYVPFGYGDPYGWYGGYYPSFVSSYSPDHCLRLVFGPDGQLRTWKKFVK
jgi:hypothetical protein